MRIRTRKPFGGGEAYEAKGDALAYRISIPRRVELRYFSPQYVTAGQKTLSQKKMGLVGLIRTSMDEYMKFYRTLESLGACVAQGLPF